MPAPMPATPLSPTGDSGGPASGPLPSAGELAGSDPVPARGKSLLRGLKMRADKRGLSESIAALGLALETRGVSFHFLADAFPDAFDQIGGDHFEMSSAGFNILVAYMVDLTAGGAGEAVVVFKPTQRYRDLMAAAATRLEFDIVDVHGWPVLSVGSGTSTVSEAAGESIPGGGAAKSPDAGGVLANIAVDAIRRQTRRGL